jgi:subtilisin-like proprotein convertase family protein
VNDKDIRSDYSEVGAPLWVCAPSSDRRADYRSIVTTENSDRYSNTFGGTSASASIVSGVAALMRHANPELTWRDLKLILAASARKNDPENTGWEDGARRYESDSATEVYSFNHEYGFGVVDAKAAIDLARNWSNFPPLPPMKSERAASGSINTPIPEAPSFGNPGTVTSKLTLNTGIRFTEFVEIRASFRRTSLRDLDIELVSPSGAVSKLAEPYYTIDGVPLSGEIRFGSAKHLGEDPNGQWTLRMTDRIRFGTGTLDSWSIKVYGHEPPAVTLNTAPVFSDSEGNLITETVRSVAENTAEGQNIGDSVAATDAEDDTLTYTLGGADADSFDIDASTGQLKTKATLNFEAQASYSVDVTATDPSGASAAIMVTIMVTDVTTGSALGDRYDADENGVITKDEAIAAVVDYFNGDITKEETIRVITLYFSSY